jgi:hypothetical protein
MKTGGSPSPARGCSRASVLVHGECPAALRVAGAAASESPPGLETVLVLLVFLALAREPRARSYRRVVRGSACPRRPGRLQGDTDLTSAGDERHPQRVRANLSGAVERCLASDTPDHASRLGLIHPPPGRSNKDRARGTATEVDVDSPGHRRGEDRLALDVALALQAQDPVTPA